MNKWETYIQELGIDSKGFTVECKIDAEVNVAYNFLDGQKNVATVEFVITDDLVKVMQLEVDPNYRNQGLGSFIVALSGYFYEKENINKLQLYFVTNEQFVADKGFTKDRSYLVDLSDSSEPFWEWRKTIIGDKK
jgi:GNAT superfamily N-acetyltransferase